MRTRVSCIDLTSYPEISFNNALLTVLEPPLKSIGLQGPGNKG